LHFVLGARSPLGYQENDFPKTSVATTQVPSVKMTLTCYDDFPPAARPDTPEQHDTVLSKRIEQRCQRSLESTARTRNYSSKAKKET
jgi:hypothetical protein